MLATVSVRTLEVADDVGLNAAVTPVGWPDAANATLPVKGLISVTLIVSVPLEPATTVSAVAEGFSVKPPVFDGPMVSAIVVVAGINAPEVPVMVTVALPWGAEALAVRVSTLVPVAGFGANAAVTPLGRPVAASVTLPVNPPASVTVIVSVPLLPWAIVRADGEEEIVKLGTGVEPSGNWMLAS